MKRFLLALSIFSVWLAIASTYYICVIKGACDSKNIEQVVKTPVPPIIKTKIVETTTNNTISDSLKITQDNLVVAITQKTVDSLITSNLKIYDKDYLLKSYYGNFKIFKNRPRVQIPFSISEYGFVIAKHMDSINSSLIINSYYNAEETKTEGLARASFIKDRLVKLGITDQLIAVNTQKALFEYNKYGKFIGGINFQFKPLDSVINLNKIDYTSIKNTTETPITTANLDTTTFINTPVVVKPELEKKPIEVTENKIATEEPISINTKEKITYSISEYNFKNNKFKANKKFKKFIKKNANAKNVRLVGYSNKSNNSKDNYDKGILLSTMVLKYFNEEGLFVGKTKLTALKNQVKSIDGNINEGVTLIIE